MSFAKTHKGERVRCKAQKYDATAPIVGLPEVTYEYVAGTNGACCGAYDELTVPASAHASLAACQAACDADASCTSIAYTAGLSGCIDGLTGPAEPTTTCPMYAGTRPTGTTWQDAIWWAQGHGLPLATEAAAWMATISFTLTAEQQSDHMVLLSLTGRGSSFPSGNSDWQVLIEHSGNDGAIGMRRTPWSLGTWSYSGTVPLLNDGQPHTVTIFKTGGDSGDDVKLFVDGTHVATAPGGGDFLPQVIASTRFQDLHAYYSTQCVSGDQKRWIDTTMLTEGIETCGASTDQDKRDCGPGSEGDGHYCTYDLQQNAFKGTIHMLHVANDVTEGNAYAACNPCQSACLMSSTCEADGFTAGYCAPHATYFKHAV